MRDKIIFGIILIGMIFYFIVMPATVAYGIVSRKLEIETLEPVGTIRELKFEGMGGY